MAEIENASSHEAENWLLLPMLSPNLTDDSKGLTIGFASQLRLLVDALDISFEGQFMEDFISVENSGSDNLKSSTIVPPPTVLDRVLKDLFHEGVQITDYGKSEHRSSRDIKGAPIESPFAQFCLHSLWFGNCNIRAIAMLWIEFVREVRWCWEESQPLPRMLTNGIIDLSASLIHQKLQMLSICIEKKHQVDHDLQDNIENQSRTSSNKEDGQAGGNQSQSAESIEEFDVKQDSPLRSESSDDQYFSGTTIEMSDSDPDTVVATEDLEQSDCIRRGSAGTVGSLMLLKSYQRMHAPYTQDAPIMTEDMHEERLRAVETLGNAFNFSAQLEKDILSSDMSAFKAANPDAVFEDFIRWHSPGDWEKCEVENSGRSKDHKMEGSKDEWPPHGKLSERMSGHGNSWRQIWNLVPALPASEQKPLLDPNREGEKILHYLETLRPYQLLEQMVCTAFRASADTLNQTPFGDLNQMTTKMGQLYPTVASALKPLQENHVSDKDEIVADLKRLCVVFEHVEKILILAASLYRKLSLVPRLLKVIFTDYFNFYLPTMGTGSVGDRIQKEFNMKQRVSMYERDAVANMFTPPTANQSWRKVLSMGNLLNGHEPILREIIFSMQDSTGDNHYSEAHSPRKPSKEQETHRMYICGSSNDLRVALSVTSSD